MDDRRNEYEQKNKSNDGQESPIWWNNLPSTAPESFTDRGQAKSFYDDGYDDLDDSPNIKKIVAIVLSVIAIIAVLGCGAAFALSHQGDAQDEEPGITQEDEEAAKQASIGCRGDSRRQQGVRRLCC